MKKTLLVLLLIFAVNSYGQIGTSPQAPAQAEAEAKAPVEIDANQLVSDAAFSRLLFNDLNFLIVGDNTPSQGISTELKDATSMLSIKGLLKAKNNWILTIDGNFSVDEGIYFFDEDNGSKQAKFALNFFFAGKYSRSFHSGNTPEVQRALLNRNFFIKDTIYKSYEKFYKLHTLMLAVKIPTEELDSLTNVIKEHINNATIIKNKPKYANIDKYRNTPKELAKEFKLEYKDKLPILDSEFLIKDVVVDGVEKNITKDLKLEVGDIVSTIVNPKKLISAYEKALAQLKTLTTTIEDLEIENAAKKWTRKRFVYGGFSPYYQRENITTFAFKEGVAFNNLFSDNRGDLYGVTFTGSYYRQSKKLLFFGRLLTKVGRGSNFASFTKNTFVSTDTINTTGSNTVFINSEKVGYSNETNPEYTYGFEISNMLEGYFTYDGIGLFGYVGYQKINFGGANAPKNIETFPFRVGALFNLKSKDETKNILTLQVFLDRSDLSIDPTPIDTTKNKDWRFGFKIGLPIFVNKQL